MELFDLGPGLVTLLVSLVGAVSAFIALWMNQRSEFKKAEVAAKEIHTLVNSRLTKVLDENTEFKRIITELLSANATRAQVAHAEAAVKASNEGVSKPKGVPQ